MVFDGPLLSGLFFLLTDMIMGGIILTVLVDIVQLQI